MTESGFLKHFVKQEELAGCYNVKINGVTVYTLLRQEFRQQMLLQSGIGSMPLRGTYNKMSLRPILMSAIQSAWQIIKLFISNKKYPIVFLPFPRIEKIGNVYVDKFTDPLIDVANITSYVILETGRMGVHLKPRAHSSNIVNADIIRVLSTIMSSLGTPLFRNKYKKEFVTFLNSLQILSKEPINEKAIVKQFFSQYIEVKIYKTIFQRLNAKYIRANTSCGTFYCRTFCGRKNF